MKKSRAALLLAVILSSVLILCLSACTPMNEGGSKQEIYFLNFKPEVADIYEEIARKYKEETGVTLKVVTAAANTYEQTLKSEIAKSDAPTIFQINGPLGYSAWKDYCADMSGSKIYEYLSDKSLAIKSGNGVYGVPYVVEGYGIIYNEEITDRYFALSNRKTVVKSMDEVDSFAELKAVVEDMTSRLSELGIDGVFASTSLKPGDDWRWQTHLANLPVYYEFRDRKIDLTSDTVTKVDFSYGDNYKSIFDLYILNSVTEPGKLGTKLVSDSMSEFALGRCAMVQNGTWAWNDIKGVDGNTVKESKIKMLPIYTGVEGEEKQGLCIGTENYFAVNSQVSQDKQKLSFDFLAWLFSSETGKKYVTDKLGFTTPFSTFGENEVPGDPLAKEVKRYMSEGDTENVGWVFTVFPGTVFKENLGAALLSYAQGKSTFDDVKITFRESWERESSLLK
ncbi:MAG: ABC transporter substrate-binding protein [Clostridia bacterium]|nr:ABC transporter substrate-binding protein [Clostridia bacterium]